MEELTVKTSLGTLVVKPSVDPVNPGVYIDLRQEGCNCDAPVAMVEVTKDEAGFEGEPILITRVWGNVAKEDYQTSVVHYGIEKYFREEG